MARSRRPARAAKRAAARSEARSQARSTLGFFGSPLQRAIVGVVALKVVALVLVVSPEGFDGSAPPKAFASRATEYALIALLVLAVLRYGLAIIPRTRAHIVVGALLLANAIALVVAEDRYTAGFGDVTRLQGATWVLDAVVLYIAVAVAFRSVSDWSVLGLSIGAATCLVLLWVLVQYAGADPFPWGRDARERPFSFLGNANVLAHYLSACVGAAAAVALFWRGRVQIGAAVLLLAIISVGSLSGTRGFLIGLGGAVAALAVIFVRVRGTSRASVVRVAAGGGLVAVVAALVLLLTPVGARTIGTFSTGALISDRVLIYRTGLAAAAERLLLGWGVDNFEAATVPHRQPDSIAFFGPDIFFTSAHDIFLQALVTTGIFGTIALAVFFVTLIAMLWRQLATAPLIAAPLLVACAAYLAQALVSVGAIEVDWLPWLALGGAVGLGHGPTELRPTRRLAQPIYAAALIAVLILTLLVLPAYWANDEAGKAFRSILAGRAAAAVEHGRAAVDLDPGRARIWARYGKALAAAGRNKEAGDAFGEAAQRASYHYEYWNNIAVTRALQAQSGDLSSGGWPAALAAVREGLRHDPYNTTLAYTLAYILDGSGDSVAAMKEISRAITVYPRDPTYDTLAAQASAHMSDVAAARAALTDILSVKDSATLRVARARASLRLRDRDAAIADLRYVLEKQDPNNRDALTLIRTIPSVP